MTSMNYRMTWRVIFVCLLFALSSCGGSAGWSSSSGSSSSSTSASSSGAQQCSRIAIESTLQTELAATTTDVDFSFYVEDQSGDSFTYNKGAATLDTAYESASTSKWITAAIIFDLVDQDILKLVDKPQDHLTASEWTIPSTDSLYNINLGHLLSFTSGLTEAAICEDEAMFDFFTCVKIIGDNNIGNGKSPGAEFYYGSNHLQVAGAMAIKAAGKSTWQEIFEDFKTRTGLFANSSYNLPSESNPKLAGGMTWTGNDYIEFLHAFVNAELFSPERVTSITSDQLEGAELVNSPVNASLSEDWHYGFGLWIECHETTFNCISTTQVSSPGDYGAYPFWNIEQNYFGIVARQGEPGTFTDGYAVFDGVRSEVESWVACQNE